MKVETIKDLSPQRTERIMRRSAIDVGDVYADVARIVNDIRCNGDAANIKQHCHLKANSSLDDLKVSDKEIEEALATVSPQLIANLKTAAANIRAFHLAQLEKPQVKQC